MTNIMVDIDGVLVDWLGKFKRLYNVKVEKHNIDYLLNKKDKEINPMGVLIDYNVNAPINELNQELVVEILEEIDSERGVLNVDLANYLYEIGKREDVNVEVVTARTRNLDATYKLMIELGFQEGHILLGMKHKEDIHEKYDIIIDDSPYLAEHLNYVELCGFNGQQTVAQKKIFMPKWSYNWHHRNKVAVYGDTNEIISAIKKRLK